MMNIVDSNGSIENLCAKQAFNETLLTERWIKTNLMVAATVSYTHNLKQIKWTQRNNNEKMKKKLFTYPDESNLFVSEYRK